MSYRLLRAADAFWRPSNQMQTPNTDLGKQLEASQLGARMWRVEPGKASTRHRHFTQEELYVLLEGEGRVRIGDEVLTLAPLDTLLVEPDTDRQLFNDTEADQLWLVVRRPAGRDHQHPGDERGAAPPHVSGGTESAAAGARRRPGGLAAAVRAPGRRALRAAA